ncbi:MAG: hypothetical protein HY302_13905 [Opitutae bacterium]|nr:hypothetical protein [Opitutae bacterium]
MPRSASAPAPPPVPLAVWRDLLAAAHEFRAARPWDFLSDRDVFALIDERQQPWFPSVLGAARQVFGVVLYRGADGLRFLFEATAIAEAAPDDALFAQDALMLDWGAKKALLPPDLAMLAALGHAPRPRERLAWPCLRSHRPGWYPWFLEEGEARELTAGLRATLAAAELARGHPGFFAPSEKEHDLLPTVTMREALAGPLRPAQVEWRHWQPSPVPAPVTVLPTPALAALAALPRAGGGGMEFDVFHAFAPVAEGARPYFPRLALMADARSGFIYATEMAPPERSWPELVTAVWIKAVRQAGARPEFIDVRRGEWLESLRPLAAALGINLRLVGGLPAIAEARASLKQFNG